MNCLNSFISTGQVFMREVINLNQEIKELNAEIETSNFEKITIAALVVLTGIVPPFIIPPLIGVVLVAVFNQIDSEKALIRKISRLRSKIPFIKGGNYSPYPYRSTVSLIQAHSYKPFEQ